MDPYDRDQMLLERHLHRQYLARACDPGYTEPYEQPTEEPDMGITNYIDLAMRTNSTVTGMNRAVSPDLLHATLGIVSENYEYDMAKSWLNAVEELGDLCWFMALAGQDLAYDPFDGWEDYIDLNPDAPLLKEAVAEFVDQVKAAYAYGKLLDVPRLRFLLSTMAGRTAKIIASKSERTPDEILMANIAKLQKRFPEKFTTEAALNRNIQQEAGAMRATLH